MSKRLRNGVFDRQGTLDRIGPDINILEPTPLAKFDVDSESLDNFSQSVKLINAKGKPL